MVSAALVVLLLGMPLGCILAGINPAHPCCPKTSVISKCPYDTLDDAKIVNLGHIAVTPIVAATVISAPSAPVLQDLQPAVAEAQPDLYVLNRILRV
jgi:hypothetical protein